MRWSSISTALLEQATDDVLASAFRSAGQRCSALRLLCLQEDIFAPALDMLIGAAAELRVGDPRDIATHVGPVIDAEAKAALDGYIAARAAEGRVLYAGAGPKEGDLVAPHIDPARFPARPDPRDFRPGAPCRDLARGKIFRTDRRDRRLGLWADARPAQPHRGPDRGTGAQGAGGEYLRQPQHDRRGGRQPALWRLRPQRQPAPRRAVPIICAVFIARRP